MTTAFQANAFQNNAFQIDIVSGQIPIIMQGVDLDKSGTTYQQMMTNLGPSLGWVMERVKPVQVWTNPSGGLPFNIISASIILVAVNAPVAFNLPDVVNWMKQPAYNPVTGFERSIWIKDYLGVAAANNITINAAAGQTIDGSPTLVINTNKTLVRLCPLNDLTGWYSV